MNCLSSGDVYILGFIKLGIDCINDITKSIKNPNNKNLSNVETNVFCIVGGIIWTTESKKYAKNIMNAGTKLKKFPNKIFLSLVLRSNTPLL